MGRTAAQFGNTWWGKQWLNAFSNIDNSNRLPRGRTYARNGSVLSVVFDKQAINAKVQGSQRTPYKVKIEVGPFTLAHQKTVLETVTENPSFLAKLLSRELPTELKEALEKQGIALFPRSWRDMSASCSCPDYAMPCKHIAAIIYLFASEIDKNPFVVFQLHGMDLLTAVEAAGFVGAQKAVAALPSLSEVLDQLLPAPPIITPGPAVLEKLDFSILPESRQELLALLTPHPLFWAEGDFKKVLEKKLKFIGQEAAKVLLGLEARPEEEKEGALQPYPEAINAIHLFLDESLACTAVQLRTLHQVTRWESKTTPVAKLSEWLLRLHPSRLYQYSLPVRALAALQRLSLLLLRQGAVLPRIRPTDKHYHYAVAWQPALQKEEVRYLVGRLAQVLPPQTLTVSREAKKGKSTEHYFPTEAQATELISLFITRFIHQKYRYEYGDGWVHQTFFQGQAIDTTTKKQAEAPSLIYLWLKRFSLAGKEITPVIKVEEGQDTDFALSLFVASNRQSLQEPLPLQAIFTRPEYQAMKLDVLQDISVLTDYFPQLNVVLASKGKKALEVDAEEFASIFKDILPLMRLLGITVMLPKSLQKLIRPSLSMTLDANAKGVEKHFLNMDDLLSYWWQVALGDDPISPEAFVKLVKGLSGIVKIRDQYVLIDSQEVQKLIATLQNPPELKGPELLQVALAEEYAGSPIRLSGKAQAVLKDLLKVERVDLPQGLQAQLRPYQQRGFEWLYKNSRVGFGSILADDMGLGKTLQVITTLLKFKEEGLLKKKKALVIVPTTLLTNWQKEVVKFAPELTVHVYHGPNRKLPEAPTDVLLTTYGVARSDADKLAKLKWYVAVIDEAQNIKNPGTAQTKAVKKLKSDIQIAMSGTPVENRLSEYWSMMDFANKGYLGSLKFFQKNYAYPIEVEQDQSQLEYFRKATAPFIIRRLKSDKSIITDLPDKVEMDEFCSLMPEQAALYQNVVDEIMAQMEGTEGTARNGLVFKLMMALKQICNHPAQFLKKGQAEPALSGKTLRLMDLLDEIHLNNEKVLIFTQFQQMGDLLQREIIARYRSETLFLHGGCSRKERDAMVEQFQHDPAVKTMLLSLKAGGTGLNLTAASNVIHYDLWWNPAVEAQATDRAFRIGQKKNVLVHRLLTQGTFEEKINHMLKEKRDLANLAVSQGEQWVGELSHQELHQLFRLEKK